MLDSLVAWRRLAALAALCLHLAFLQRNLSIVYGADIVSAFWLFYLVLGENDRAFSVRAWWRARVARAAGAEVSSVSSWSSALSGVSLRLIQIQLCVIYGYTGMEKLKGAPWWD
ncbi:MAG: hypothetical protein NDI61_13860, partial [Bdellovibrionaceae bacterium]|nr:hypothetical protein [Pseudobdellovibrionaceae bacterium]